APRLPRPRPLRRAARAAGGPPRGAAAAGAGQPPVLRRSRVRLRAGAEVSGPAVSGPARVRPAQRPAAPASHPGRVTPPVVGLLRPLGRAVAPVAGGGPLVAVLRCAPLLKGSLAGVAGAGVGAAVQVAVVLVVVRAFPAEVAGAFCTLMALSLMCAGVLRMDAGNALVRALARAVPAPGPDTRAAAAVVRDARVTVAGTRTARPLSAAERGASGCIRAAVAPVFGLSCVAAVGLLLCAEPLSGALGMPPGWVRTAAAALPMISCSEVLVAATRGFGTVRPTLYLSGL